MDGNTYTLWSLRGRPVILNFWATWCHWCKIEMAGMDNIYNKYKDERGLLILAIDGDGESFSDISEFLEENWYSFPFLVDTSRDINDTYEIEAFPTSFFIDSYGVIRYMNEGSLEEQEFEQILTDYIFPYSPFQYNPATPTPVQDPLNMTPSAARGAELNLPGEIWSANITKSHIYDHNIVSDVEFTDFSMQVDVRIESETSEYHGLLFREQDGENFYTFRITPDGYYEFDVWKTGDRSYETILGPLASDHILKGAGKTNQLKVIANGQTFELYINDNFVGSITDDTFASGRVGLLSCTCDGSSNASATFMDLWVQGNP